jgi:dGTPase
VRKFGVYDDDRPAFDWMRASAPLRETCVEAQIMDLADDIAYSVHDVEDGVVAGRIELTALADPSLRADVWETVRDWYAPDTSTDELEDGFARLTSMPAWPQAAYDGTRRQLAGLKNLTSRLINRFCSGVQEEVEQTDLPRPIVRYAGRIPVPATVETEIAILKGIAAHLVMKADDRVQVLTRQRVLLTELVEATWAAAPATLEASFAADWAAAADDPARRRIVIDQVASLTDLSAVDRHRALQRTA